MRGFGAACKQHISTIKEQTLSSLRFSLPKLLCLYYTKLVAKKLLKHQLALAGEHPY